MSRCAYKGTMLWPPEERGEGEKGAAVEGLGRVTIGCTVVCGRSSDLVERA